MFGLSQVGEEDYGLDESKDSFTEFEEAVDVNKYPFIEKYFGLPLLVVGCKADLISTNDAAAIRDARDLQGRIRGTPLGFRHVRTVID